MGASKGDAMKDLVTLEAVQAVCRDLECDDVAPSKAAGALAEGMRVALRTRVEQLQYKLADDRDELTATGVTLAQVKIGYIEELVKELEDLLA